MKLTDLEVGLLLSILAWTLLAGSTLAAPEPTLHIPKETYALGEAIFFYTGVRSATPMTQRTYFPCDTEIVDPGGRVTTGFLSWPADGSNAHGWSGGTSVPQEDVIPGVYVVRVTCGDATVEGRFTVEDLPVLNDIEARFDVSPGCDGRRSDATATLKVVNRSDQTLFIARPGALMATYVGFRWQARKGTGGSCSGFIPAEALGVTPRIDHSFLIDLLAYDDLGDAPHERLRPAETYVRSFCVSAGRATCPQPAAWPPARGSWSRPRKRPVTR